MKTAEQLIAAKRRIDEFMKDEAVVECLASMKWKAYTDFVEADSNEKRIIAQAQARNLEEFATQLGIVQDRGTVEIQRLAIAEKQKREF